MDFPPSGPDLGILIGMIAGSCGIYLVIEKRKFPPITQNDLLLNIEWNKRINAVENERRTSRLTDHLKPLLSQYTVMAGSQKFLLSHTKENSVSEAIVYLENRPSRQYSGFKRKNPLLSGK